MQLLFAFTLLTSAMLLFAVQPMFAKMVLPQLGGTPAVWNTCMVFYQAVLLGGYLYAHLSTKWLGTRRQAAVHLAVLCLPWLSLPIGIASCQSLSSAAHPIAWLLACLTLSVGLPFFVVSASAPMLQAWFADTGHPAGRDPYFLYAASNFGSLAALLGYPFLVEPAIALAGQSWAWMWGYGLLMLLTLACAVRLWRSPSLGVSREGGRPTETATAAVQGPLAWGRRLHWLALAFVPSSLLLGVTNHISTDIAAVPLLWVVPLALYLLTFVLAFSRWPTLPHQWARQWAAAWKSRHGAEPQGSPGQFAGRWLSALAEAIQPHRFFVWLQPLMVLALAVVFFRTTEYGVDWLVFLHLAAFFVTAMVCHGELAEWRPASSHLTEFYIWMSVGGVLGGLFNALVAPSLLTTVLEYPLVVVVACLLRPQAASRASPVGSRALDVVIPVMLLAAIKGLIDVAGWSQSWGEAARTFPFDLVVLSVAALVAFSSQERPIRFGACVGVMLLASHLWFTSTSDALYIGRSFFGVVKVKESREPVSPTLMCVRRTMVHGSTTHGEQRFVQLSAGAESPNPPSHLEPLTYYSRTGPLGQVINRLIDPARHRELGVVGLGTGTIAAWGQAGQTITFFEIDPTVVRIANDPRYFTYLSESAAQIDVALGDARVKLQEQPDGRFDLLVIDAFSSDAIPLHLLTREALQLYFSKLAPQGLVMVHISNRSLNLAPVLGNLAADAGLAGWRCNDRSVSQEESRWGKAGSEWVVLARDVGRLGSLIQEKAWEQIPTEARVGLWTDDFSNILTVLKWARAR